MVTYFAGGAAGTALATFAWSRWGWPGTVAVGAAAPVAAFAAWAVGGVARAGVPRVEAGV
jgi:hypothetical protein